MHKNYFPPMQRRKESKYIFICKGEKIIGFIQANTLQQLSLPSYENDDTLSLYI